MLRLNINNWQQPSEKKFKKIADILLYSLPLYLGAVMTSPMDETLKLWVNFGITFVIITVKTISKFTKEE